MSGTPHQDFSGKVALITGAAGMIGSAVARRLHAAGAALGLADRNGCGDLAAELSGSDGARVLDFAADLTDPAAVREVFGRTIDELGGLEVLVTVAGVTSTGAFESITPEEWDRVHAINLRSVFLCNQAAIAPMKSAGAGRIVNMGSVLAKNGGNPRPWLDPAEQDGAANAAYGTSKAGVHALTLYLAKELAAHNITVNAVAPGPVRSPMTTRLPEALIKQIPVGRLGEAEEIAEAVCFLCGRQSGFITGEILDANGGLWVD